MMEPTPEQVASIAMAAQGGDMVIEALAGTGKTTTLRLIAEELCRSGRRGTYVAFNRAIVEEAKTKFPNGVECATAHSLAMRSVGKRYRHRLNGRRIKSTEIARILGIDRMRVKTEAGSKDLAAGFLAGVVMGATRRFCQTADERPTRRHVPVPRAARQDPIFAELYGVIAAEMEPFVVKAWADLSSLDGRLPFDHGVYLKLYQLGDPKIPGSFLMFDEAQDANPVMLSIVEQQTHLQRIYVGDQHQQIYEWNGAVNSLASVDTDRRCWLTTSFRFGADIAAAANDVLDVLGAPKRLEGVGAPGHVGPLFDPHVILSRTNASAVGAAIKAIDDGNRPHIVGGASDVISFCRAGLDLQAGRGTQHPELACFDTWNDVLIYAAEDELGGDLALLVKLISDHGAERIIAVLDGMPSEADADVILSTAHKAKGREWPTVRLAGDFPEDPTDEELRLLYVAVTRAERILDVDSVPFYAEPETPGPADGACDDGLADMTRVQLVNRGQIAGVVPDGPMASVTMSDDEIRSALRTGLVTS